MKGLSAVWQYLAGLVTGWTWVTLAPVSGLPSLSGRRYWTENGARKDWRRYMDARGRAPVQDRVVFLRRPYVEAWLDGWRVADSGRTHPAGVDRKPRTLRPVTTWEEVR